MSKIVIFKITQITNTLSPSSGKKVPMCQDDPSLRGQTEQVKFYSQFGGFRLPKVSSHHYKSEVAQM